MPPTATKGSRNKFYNKIAADARRAETLILPMVSASSSQVDRSPEPSVYNGYSPLATFSGHLQVKADTRAQEWVRASGQDRDDTGPYRSPNGTIRRSDRRESIKTPDRTLSPHSRVQDWVDTSSTPLHRQTGQTTSTLSSNPQEYDQAQTSSDQDVFSPHVNSPLDPITLPTPSLTKEKETKPKQDPKMEHDQLAAFQRFMARSMSPLPSAARRREYSKPVADDRNSFFARSKYPDITSPVPVLNLPVRDRYTETIDSRQEIRRKKLEKEKLDALKLYQDAERKLEEDAAAATHHDQQRDASATLVQEIAELRDELKHYKDSLRMAQAMLETHQSQASSEASQAAREQERMAQQIEDLQFALSKAESELDAEKTKRGKAELESDSSKKGQSAMAKAAHDAEVRAKDAEGKMKDYERRETVERERRAVAERKVEQQAAELAIAQRNAAFQADRAQEARNAKEQALLKLRTVTSDCAKLTDKLNIVRLENESIQARVVELTVQVQAGEKLAQEKKRLKEECHKERATSDRLRAERNDLRERNDKLAIQNRRLKASKTYSSRYESTDLGSDLERPRTASPRKVVSSLARSASTLSHAMGAGEGSVKKEKTIVISDPDGEDLPVQRVIQDDQDQQDAVKGEGVKVRVDKPTSSLPTSKRPPLNMSSAPLEPVRKSTPASTVSLLGPEVEQKRSATLPKVIFSSTPRSSSLGRDVEAKEMKKETSLLGLSDIESRGSARSKTSFNADIDDLSKGMAVEENDPFAGIGAEYGLSLPETQSQSQASLV
ncbi:hypothetical protein IAU59_006716 [Kwoniella sp. CBS 9459]